MNNKVEKELNKSQGIFISRAIIFALLLLSPMVYVFIRYKCWDITQKISFSGWGILGIILGVIGIYAFFRYLLFGGKWAYWKQVVKGILKVGLPFGLMIGLIYLSIDYLKELMYVLVFSGICFLGAYLVNPFPEWAYNKSLGETADVVEFALKRHKGTK